MADGGRGPARRGVACSAQDERRERDAVVRSDGDTRPHQAPVRCRR